MFTAIFYPNSPREVMFATVILPSFLFNRVPEIMEAALSSCETNSTGIYLDGKLSDVENYAFE